MELALDRNFELSEAEVAFHRQRTEYDRMYNVATLSYFATERLSKLRGRRARELSDSYGIQRIDRTRSSRLCFTSTPSSPMDLWTAPQSISLDF